MGNPNFGALELQQKCSTPKGCPARTLCSAQCIIKSRLFFPNIHLVANIHHLTVNAMYETVFQNYEEILMCWRPYGENSKMFATEDVGEFRDVPDDVDHVKNRSPKSVGNIDLKADDLR